MINDRIDVDIAALFSLKNAIGRSSQELKDIGMSIDYWLSSTLDRLHATVVYFQRKLEEAQHKVVMAQNELCSAQRAYETCLRSQERSTDEDGRTCYTPSCSFQAARATICRKTLQQAEQERDVWKQKTDAALGIEEECRKEIDRYNFPGSIMLPCGGRRILSNLAGEHSEAACMNLDRTIGAVLDLQSFSFETGESAPSAPFDAYGDGIADDGLAEEDRNVKREKFEDATTKVEDLMKDKYAGSAQPDVFEICPRCGKFKYVNCTCIPQNERER